MEEVVAQNDGDESTTTNHVHANGASLTCGREVGMLAIVLDGAHKGPIWEDNGN